MITNQFKHPVWRVVSREVFCAYCNICPHLREVRRIENDFVYITCRHKSIDEIDKERIKLEKEKDGIIREMRNIKEEIEKEKDEKMKELLKNTLEKKELDIKAIDEGLERLKIEFEELYKCPNKEKIASL